MILFAVPCPGMVYDNPEPNLGEPVTIIGLRHGTDRANTEAIVVNGDGDLVFVEAALVTFVGLVPDHTNTMGAFGRRLTQ